MEFIDVDIQEKINTLKEIQDEHQMKDFLINENKFSKVGINLNTAFCQKQKVINGNQ